MFQPSSSVIQYFLHSHSTIFVLKRRMCGMAFLFCLVAVCDKVDDRKNIFYAQDKFRVFVSDIEWGGEEKSLGYFDQVIFKGRNSPDDVVWLKINRTTLAEESGMGHFDPYHSAWTKCPHGKMNTAPIIENKEARREARIIQSIRRIWGSCVFP